MEQDNERKGIDDKLEDIIFDYNKEEDVQKKAKIKIRKRYEIKEKVIFYMHRMVLFLSFAAIIYIFALAFSQQQEISRKPLWVMGMQRSSDYKLTGCIANLWKARDAIDRFYATNKRFPQQLTELYEGGFLSGRLECPASRQEYKINVISGRRIITCPDPAQHGISRVWLDVTSGPPRIERW